METILNIRKNNEIFKGIKHVLEAISKDKTREVLTYVKIENDRILATDGWRLHIYKYDNNIYEPGLYTVNKNTASEVLLIKNDNIITKYPNIDVLIPNDTNDYNTLTKIDNSTYILSEKASAIDISIAMYYLALQGIIVNYEVVQATFKYSEGTIQYNTNRKPLIISCDCFYSLIMPIRVKGIE